MARSSAKACQAPRWRLWRPPRASGNYSNRLFVSVFVCLCVLVCLFVYLLVCVLVCACLFDYFVCAYA